MTLSKYTLPVCPVYTFENGQWKCAWSFELQSLKVESPVEHAYNMMTGKVESNPAFDASSNFNPAKVIGDAINALSKKFTEFMTKIVLPFMIGIIGLIMLMLAVGYVFR